MAEIAVTKEPPLTMRNLLYISYGTGLHEQEAIFSLLSAWRWLGVEIGDVRFLIYTDNPGKFSHLPITTEYIAPERWLEWSGPTNFNHRRKIIALRHALERYQCPTVLLDADTWLRRSPHYLFGRIAPGKSIMHIREAKIDEIATPQGRKIADLLTRERFIDFHGQELIIPTSTFMWNAGVIGLDYADIGLLDDVLQLTDQLCTRSNLHILEQLSFSYVLSQRSDLRESHDVVFHYWPPYLHQPFQQRLPSLMRACANLPLTEQISECYRQRPRPTMLRRVKVVLKIMAQALGLLRGRSRSNEW